MNNYTKKNQVVSSYSLSILTYSEHVEHLERMSCFSSMTLHSEVGRVDGSSWISPFTLDLIAAFTTISKKNIAWYILVYLPRLLGLLAKCVYIHLYYRYYHLVI